MRTLFILVFVVGIGSPHFAVADEVETIFKPIPTSVSGTFKPFALAVDGKKLLRDPRPLKKLIVNEQEVRPEKEKQLPFFAQSDRETLDIEIEFQDGETKDWRFELPRLELEEATKQMVIFKAVGPAREVLVDGARVGFNANTARWPLPAGKAAFAKSRVVEVSGGKGRPGRLYNLKLIGDFGSRQPAAVRSLETWSLASFRLSQFSVFQSGGRNSFSGFLSWSPSVALAPMFRLGLSVGGSSLKAVAGTNFLVWAAEGWLGWQPGLFGLEVGGGLQSWIDNGGTRPMAGLTANKFFERPWIGFLDRIFLSYSYFMSTPDPSHQARLGVGMTF